LGTVDQQKVKEYITHSWYEYASGDTTGLHPLNGETSPNYTGPQPPYEFLDTDENDKYSWLKSPRYEDMPMEVGPLSRMLIAYVSPDSPSHDSVKEKVDAALEALDVGPEALLSTLGRVAARGIETWVMVEQAQVWLDELVANIGSGDLRIHNGERWLPSSWPAEAEGFGLSDAPRGALGHWVKIKNGRIENYQCVVPSTWNGGPRDANSNRGPYEESLIGTPIADPEKPLEVLRTIHSFDPCMACAAHIVDVKGREITSIKVL
jgi:Ni,Fe-hydrogenase I large subunit